MSRMEVPAEQKRLINEALKPVARHGLTLKAMAKAVESGKPETVDLAKVMEALVAIEAAVAKVKSMLAQTTILADACHELAAVVRAGTANWPSNADGLPTVIPIALRSLMDAVRTCLEFTFDAEPESHVRKASLTEDALAANLSKFGLRLDTKDGTTRQILHSALPPELDLPSVITAVSGGGSANTSTTTTPAPSSPVRPSGPTTPSSPAPAKAPAGPAAGTAAANAAATATAGGAPAAATASPPKPRVAYSTASIRVAKYSDKFSQHLAAFSKHTIAIIEWATKVSKDGVADQAFLDRGTHELEQLTNQVASLVALSEVPLKAVGRQVIAVKEHFAAVAFTVLNPTSEELTLAEDLIETVTALREVVKAMLALNVLAQRGSIIQASSNEVPASPMTPGTPSSIPRKVFRLLIVGDQGVGKTTLIRRIAGQSVDNVQPTVQAVELNVLKLPVGAEPIELQVVDTTSDTQLWEQNAFVEFFTVVDAVLIVLDVTRLNAHYGVARWTKNLAGYPSVYRCAIANKMDAIPNEQRAELRKAAREVSNIDRFETSGLSNTGVTIMLEAIMKNIEERSAPS